MYGSTAKLVNSHKWRRWTPHSISNGTDRGALLMADQTLVRLRSQPVALVSVTQEVPLNNATNYANYCHSCDSMKTSKDTWVCSHRLTQWTHVKLHRSIDLTSVFYTQRIHVCIHSLRDGDYMSAWALSTVLTITLERSVVLQMDGTKNRGEHIRLTDHMEQCWTTNRKPH